jgi:hypothetical protein
MALVNIISFINIQSKGMSNADEHRYRIGCVVNGGRRLLTRGRHGGGASAGMVCRGRGRSDDNGEWSNTLSENG